MKGNSSPRKPLIATFLAIIAPGLGQVYNGELKKGLGIFLFIIIGFLYLFKLIGLYSSFMLMVLTLTGISGFQIYFIYDAFRTAKSLRDYHLKGYNRWFVYLSWFILCSFLYVLQQALFPFQLRMGSQTFTVSSPSMEPTIHEGDHIVTDFSFSPKSIANGDLVVFEPQQGSFSISRVVALPGDRFEMVNNFIILNGKRSLVKKVTTFSAMHERYPDVSLFSEAWPNGKAINIYKYPQSDSSIANRPSITIPKDSVLLISDNRDNALDGRYLGLMPLSSIQGKILYSFWGKSLDRVGVDFSKR